MNRDIFLALMAYLILLVTSFVVSIGLGFGEAESARDLSSFWLYGRRGFMIIVAIAIPWFSRGETPAAVGWRLTWRWALIALPIGVFLGFFNRGGFDPTEAKAIPLALFHTFSMELFFRGYLLRTLADSMKRLWIPLFLAAFLYAISYLNMWTVWGLPLADKLMFVLRFIFVGVLFGYVYMRSGSLTVNWMIHFFTALQYRLLL
jgi:membrane protease YdiL (CAAX protease family)